MNKWTQSRAMSDWSRTKTAFASRAGKLSEAEGKSWMLAGNFSGRAGKLAGSAGDISTTEGNFWAAKAIGRQRRAARRER